MLRELAELTKEVHYELNLYKGKRRDKKILLEKRLEAPQTKTMKKKLKGHRKEISK